MFAGEVLDLPAARHQAFHARRNAVDATVKVHATVPVVLAVLVCAADEMVVIVAVGVVGAATVVVAALVVAAGVVAAAVEAVLTVAAFVDDVVGVYQQQSQSL